MITLDTIPLPSGLIWTNEYDAQQVAQTVQRTLSGGTVVFHAPITSGQLITLQSESDAGWADRTTVQALQSRAAVAGGIYTLTLRGTSRQVMFAHHDAPALQATPVFHIAAPGASHPYLITLKLITL